MLFNHHPMDNFVCKFQVFCRTSFGQSVALVGNNALLGEWSPHDSIRLKYTANYVWESPELSFPNLSQIEYKYILFWEDGSACWEAGENKRLHSLQSKSYFINDSFGTNFTHVLLKSEELNVMSFNIRFKNPHDKFQWVDRQNEVALIINERKPDLIGIQEALDEQLRDLLSLLPEYDFVGVARDDGKRSGEYSPILYLRSRFKIVKEGTFWLSETPGFPSKSWGAACVRICTFADIIDLCNTSPGQVVRMYNTHLDHISHTARHEGSKLILDHLFDVDYKYRKGIVLTGDFNVCPEDKTICLLSHELYQSRNTASVKINEDLPDRKSVV